jgi:hypothetical protein
VYWKDGRFHKFFYSNETTPADRRLEQGYFGEIKGRVVGTRPASPAEAMARIEWFNLIYPEARIDVEGVSPTGTIHTSQPPIDGRLASSFRDLAEAMANGGWVPYFAEDSDPATTTFYHPVFDVYMTDVVDTNGKIVVGSDGKKRFQPFDVVIVVPTQE